MKRRILYAIFLLVAARPMNFALGATDANTRYAPPEATFNAGNQLHIFQTELENKAYDDAAHRIDDLLRDNGNALMSPGDDGSAISVATWIRNLPADTKKQLATALEAIEGQPAAHALDDLKSKPTAEPAEFYSLAQRYPFAGIAAKALLEGAHRAAEVGDIPTARCLLELAIAHGAAVDDPLRHELGVTDPQSAKNPPAAIGSGYRGPLPFEATWYGGSLRESWTALRSFPTMAGGIIFIAAPSQVIALKETGGLLWQGPIGESVKPGKGAPDPEGVTRGPAFSVQVFCDTTGSPQIVLVRQPEIRGDGWAIRALRASDGKPIWSTEGMEQYRGLVFGSTPAVEGRYVYAIAGDPGEQVDRVYLLALELTTGRQLWRADIGNITRTRVSRRPNKPPDVFRPWLHQAAPLVVDDCVIAAPDVGAVLRVGRFDGKTCWVMPYNALPEPTSASPDESRRVLIEMRRAKAPPLFRPTQPAFSNRYSNTPAVSGHVVIAAPQDSDAVLGVDLATGKQLWSTPGMADATLLGVREKVAILGGLSVTAVNIDTGQIAWTNADLKGNVTGPSVLAGKQVYVPTAAGMVSLDVQNGRSQPAAERIPVMRSILASDVARTAMTMADVIGSFVRDRPEAKSPGGNGR